MPCERCAALEKALWDVALIVEEIAPSDNDEMRRRICDVLHVALRPAAPQESAPTPSCNASDGVEPTVGVPAAGSEQPDLPLGHKYEPCPTPTRACPFGGITDRDGCHYWDDSTKNGVCGQLEPAHLPHPFEDDARYRDLLDPIRCATCGRPESEPAHQRQR